VTADRDLNWSAMIAAIQPGFQKDRITQIEEINQNAVNRWSYLAITPGGPQAIHAPSAPSGQVRRQKIAAYALIKKNISKP
jgi:hypothetical protein